MVGTSVDDVATFLLKTKVRRCWGLQSAIAFAVANNVPVRVHACCVGPSATAAPTCCCLPIARPMWPFMLTCSRRRGLCQPWDDMALDVAQW